VLRKRYLFIVFYFFFLSIHSQTTNADKIFSTSGAFTAYNSDNSLYTWGFSGSGGNVSGVNFEGILEEIVSTGSAFAALNSDGKVFTWGSEDYGGVVNKAYDENNLVELDNILNSGVSKIYSNKYSFLAVTDNNVLISWGANEFGGYIEDDQIYENENNKVVKKVVSNDYSFAVLFTDGSVITWGDYDDDYEGVYAEVVATSGIDDIWAHPYGFLAIGEGVDEIIWGWEYYDDFGNSGDLNLTSVKDLKASDDESVTAIRSDGTAVSYGLYGDSSSLVDELINIEKLEVNGEYGYGSAFAALRSDGKVFVWGDGPSLWCRCNRLRFNKYYSAYFK
jgi:hypothetical protein